MTEVHQFEERMQEELEEDNTFPESNRLAAVMKTEGEALTSQEKMVHWKAVAEYIQRAQRKRKRWKKENNKR